jgi:FkbM family methyltransferase
VIPGIKFQVYPKGELIDYLPFFRLFERTEMQLVAHLLRPGMKVIDAGANIGVYSLLAAQCIGSEGKVWAFEPSESTYGLLLDNLALNDVRTVRATRLALGDARGHLTLRCQNGFGDLYRHLDYSGHANVGDRVETVEVSTLDEFAAASGIDTIDFFKIDVEGGEYHLLKGSGQLLSRSPSVVVMVEIEEDWCLRNGHRVEDCFKLLKSLGFTLYSLSKQQNRWISDESELSACRTVWAARNPQLLPTVPAHHGHALVS